MNRPFITPRMPRQARRYYNVQLWESDCSSQPPVLKDRAWIIGQVRQLSRLWPVTTALVVIPAAFLVIVALLTYEAWDRAFERFLNSFDWRGADRMAKFATGTLIALVALYLSVCFIAAINRGSFDRLVR